MSTDRSTAIAFLRQLGAPTSEAMIRAVITWRQREGPLTGQVGTGSNDPFNIETTAAVAAKGKWYDFQRGWVKGRDSGSSVLFA